MTSPKAKRLQENEANQNKDFAWTVPVSSEEEKLDKSSVTADEKAKIDAITFPNELKFDVPVNLEGSKYAFNAVKEGMASNSDLAKSFTKVKQLNPQQLLDLDPLGLDDATITGVMS